MKTEHGLDLPRRLQIEFSRVVQNATDTAGGEVDAKAMWTYFAHEYLDRTDPVRCSGPDSDTRDEDTSDRTRAHGSCRRRGAGRERPRQRAGRRVLRGAGHGRHDVRVLDYVEHALSAGGDAKAAAYLECAIDGQVVWGVGIDSSIITASLKAVVSAVNRAGLTEA